MRDKQHGKYFYECDSCDELLTPDTGDHEEAERVRKAEGWRATQIGSDWVHTCTACSR